jgi:hypothetical protein
LRMRSYGIVGLISTYVRTVWKISKGKPEAISQRSIDTTMAKRKRTKGQTMMYKTLHIKLKIKQHEHHKLCLRYTSSYWFIYSSYGPKLIYYFYALPGWLFVYICFVCIYLFSCIFTHFLVGCLYIPVLFVYSCFVCIYLFSCIFTHFLVGCLCIPVLFVYTCFVCIYLFSSLIWLIYYLLKSHQHKSK